MSNRNWMKIASDRLRSLKVLRRFVDRIESELVAEVDRQLRIYFHARCLEGTSPGSKGDEIIKQMSKGIADGVFHSIAIYRVKP